MKMNLPNKLTILRVLMIPLFVVFMEVEIFGTADRYIAAAIFVIASFTDLLDGKLARRYNLVTNFGKFMDPLADKLLVCSALICLTGVIPKWVVIVIISRDFIISGFRLVASDNNVVIAANMWGKVKTVFQMIMIVWLLLDFSFEPIGKAYYMVGRILIYVSLALTVISLVDYIRKNIDVLKGDK